MISISINALLTVIKAITITRHIVIDIYYKNITISKQQSIQIEIKKVVGENITENMDIFCKKKKKNQYFYIYLSVMRLISLCHTVGVSVRPGPLHQ